jgi:hypothetical protein
MKVELGRVLIRKYREESAMIFAYTLYIQKNELTTAFPQNEF